MWKQEHFNHPHKARRCQTSAEPKSESTIWQEPKGSEIFAWASADSGCLQLCQEMWYSSARSDSNLQSSIQCKWKAILVTWNIKFWMLWAPWAVLELYKRWEHKQAVMLSSVGCYVDLVANNLLCSNNSCKNICAASRHCFPAQWFQEGRGGEKMQSPCPFLFL